MCITSQKYLSSDGNINYNKNPNVLVINPWIHDFAAYDFWAKPMGLLILASLLKIHGAKLSYIDCLNRHHPLSKIKSNIFTNGRGPYIKTPIQKPAALKHIPRNYCRYGILPNWFEQDLKKIDSPDIILMTSSMTYWYPGTNETILAVKRIYPDVPIIVGGIYPSLCTNHAVKNLRANYIITGPGEPVIMPLMYNLIGWSPKVRFNSYDLETYPLPAFDLQHEIDYLTILTGRGCPYNCSYCASNFLQPKILRRDYHSVINEIAFWNKHHKVDNFVFYDDALLSNPNHHIIPMLELIIKYGLKIKIHTPNAIHIREVSKKIATLMFAAGFDTIRLGLETANFQNRQQIDMKVTCKEFIKAAQNLINAGFNKNQIGVYLLVGLPKQDITEIIESINIVVRAKLTPILAHYSPIPNTSMWEDAIIASRYNLESDPIFTNNAISPCTGATFPLKTLIKLKQKVRIYQN